MTPRSIHEATTLASPVHNDESWHKQDGSIFILNGRYQLPIDELLRDLYLAADDLVVVGGSLIDGYGNAFSDVDVYVVTERRPAIERVEWRRHDWMWSSSGDISEKRSGVLHETFDYVADTRLAINVEYIERAEAQARFEHACARYLDALTHTQPLSLLSYRESHFLHRLLSGVPIRNGSLMEAIVGKFDTAKLCYLGYRTFVGNYPAFRDVCGACVAGNWENAALLARSYLSGQMMALTFLGGQSNPNIKWVLSKARGMPPDYKGIVAEYERVLLEPIRTADEQAKIVWESLDLIDRILMASHRLLDLNPAFLSTHQALRLLREERQRHHAHPDIEGYFSLWEKLYAETPDKIAEMVRQSIATVVEARTAIKLGTRRV
ncbi:hypothetical protein [Bradyrhizobium sp. BR 10261]|uniref:hypothetical protein n=1 Tax=Bradyrhizobium sp. BR 10261 TaxID=2749992 RepID=UPI001C64A0B6|nr:hypothetical protein [Bradyrhizobium sp. BR 10261]MBW7962521.1 hypothetical protein [Bradyrhizobium sp. BR 10261]